VKKSLIFIILFVFIMCNYGYPDLLDALKDNLNVTSSTKSTSGKIDLGLKEALRVGIKKAIKSLGKNNGYFANKNVKILLPEDIRKMEAVLRGIGVGPKLDEFTLSMNRAAEKAAPLAADIFSTAITEISFDDASKILKGGNTAATGYLKTKTYAKLLALFQPTVRKTMNDYKVTKKFESINDKVQTVPYVDKLPNIDMNKYVSSKALDGLFYILGQEETNIRTNPKARVTALLKDVFK
jgi:hypothetical protein